jgi:hypothetical protein
VNYDDDGLGAEAQKALFGLAGGATVEPQKFGTVVLGRVGCPLTDTVTVSDKTRADLSIAGGIQVYPTVTERVVNIITDSEETIHYSLYSSTGILIERDQFRRERVVSLQGHVSGLYLLCIHNKSDKVIYRIVKK